MPMANTASLIVAIDFGGTKVAVAAGTPDGRVVAEARMAVSQAPDAKSVVSGALCLAQELAQGQAVRAVGVSSMGITEEHGVRLAPNVPGWEALQLPRLVRDAFPGVPYAVVNDVKAALLGEMRWGALAGGGVVAYLNLGTGIALAFGQDGLPWTGAHQAAGEIAYLWHRGEAGFRDGHAPFEERWGGGAMDREAERRFGLAGGLPAAFRAAADRPDVAAWLLEAFDEMAWAVGQALLVLDVGRVAVGGGLVAEFDRLAAVFEAAWTAHLPFPPELVPARFRDNAGVMGALAVGAQLL
jgi:glucokinase